MVAGHALIAVVVSAVFGGASSHGSSSSGTGVIKWRCCQYMSGTGIGTNVVL